MGVAQTGSIPQTFTSGYGEDTSVSNKNTANDQILEAVGSMTVM